MYEAQFVTADDIGNPSVVARLVDGSGAPVDAVLDEVRNGAGDELVRASMRDAADHEIFGTPAWMFESGFVLPGVQARELYARVVRAGETTTQKRVSG